MTALVEASCGRCCGNIGDILHLWAHDFGLTLEGLAERGILA
jgi:hypothetical protein